MRTTFLVVPMSRIERPPGLALLLVVLVALAGGPPFVRSGQADPPPHSRARSHASDPCEHEPHGEAIGREGLCPRTGSSSGIARGDFNGDGFADLAVGTPFDDLVVERRPLG
jgi:hypothetical protein